MSPRLRQTRAVWVVATLSAALVLALAAGTVFGSTRVSLPEIGAALGSLARGGASTTAEAIIVDVRLPRVVLAALVGACLAGAGLLYQALFRNPLADPYILGVSSGAGLGAMLAIVATSGAAAGRFGAVPLAAFAGALLTIVLVVRLASWRGRLDTTSLLLGGVAISYTLAAMTSFVMVLSREQMASIVYWMMGGLTAASWAYVAAVAPMLVVGAALPLLYWRRLNLMLLGEERAGQLGLDVERFKRLMLASASLMTAAAVSVSGLIGFVGLMVPHASRLVLGPDHRVLVPASLLGGATVMVLADLVARTVLAPVEIPVGIVTALAGGPFFVWILRRGDRT